MQNKENLSMVLMRMKKTIKLISRQDCCSCNSKSRLRPVSLSVSALRETFTKLETELFAKEIKFEM